MNNEVNERNRIRKILSSRRSNRGRKSQLETIRESNNEIRNNNLNEYNINLLRLPKKKNNRSSPSLNIIEENVEYVNNNNNVRRKGGKSKSRSKSRSKSKARSKSRSKSCGGRSKSRSLSIRKYKAKAGKKLRSKSRSKSRARSKSRSRK